MDEGKLIKKAKAGDSTAFSQLYDLYKNRLYRYAFYRLGNSDDAQDAVSDCIVSAFEGIRHLKNAAAFPSWIFKILYAQCNKYIARQKSNRENAVLEDYENSADIALSVNTDKTELQEALSMLNNDEKDIVLLCVVAGLTSKEAGELVGLTSGSVRSKLSRSLSKMRDFLEG